MNSDTRRQAHRLVDRMAEEQLSGLVQFLEAVLGPAKEEIGRQEEQAVAEAREWVKHNKPIPHEEVLAEFGLALADFERMGRTPLPKQRNRRRQPIPRTGRVSDWSAAIQQPKPSSPRT